MSSLNKWSYWFFSVIFSAVDDTLLNSLFSHTQSAILEKKMIRRLHSEICNSFQWLSNLLIHFFIWISTLIHYNSQYLQASTKIADLNLMFCYYYVCNAVNMSNLCIYFCDVGIKHSFFLNNWIRFSSTMNRMHARSSINSLNFFVELPLFLSLVVHN